MTVQKLSLNKESLRVLQSDELDRAAGGVILVTQLCKTLLCPIPTTTLTTRFTFVCADPSPHPDRH